MATTATNEAVRTAADALMLENTEPTPEKVRRRIGGGSYSTIAKLLKSWKAERAELLQMNIDIPAEVDVKAKELLRTVWTAAVMDATKQADAARDAARIEIERISSELNDATAEIASLEERTLNHEQTIKDLSSELRQRDMRLAVMEADTDRRQSELEKTLIQLEEARAALIQKAELVGRQEGELEAMRKQIKSLQDQVGTRNRK